MKPLFKELVKGNVPDGFKLAKGKKRYFLYRTNPSTEQVISFNLDDANDQKFEEKCKEVFRILGCRLDEKTKTWKR